MKRKEYHFPTREVCEKSSMHMQSNFLWLWNKIKKDYSNNHGTIGIWMSATLPSIPYYLIAGMGSSGPAETILISSKDDLTSKVLRPD